MKNRWLFLRILVLLSILAVPGLIGCNDDTTPKTGVLEGKIRIDPLEEQAIGQPYPPEIFQARKVMVYDADRSTLIKQVDLNENGYYSVELPAGTYTIDINYVENDSSNDVPRKLKVEPGIEVTFDIGLNLGIVTPPPTGLPELAGSWQIGENFYYGLEPMWGDTLVGLEFKYEDDKLVGYYLSTYNLNSHEKKQVLEIPDSRFVSEPSIYEDKIVWASVDKDAWLQHGLSSTMKPEPNWDVFILDLTTGEVKQLTNEEHAQMTPRIYGDTVIWSDARNQDTDRYPFSYDIFAYDLKTGKETRITANTTVEGYNHASLSGNYVAWTDMRHADMSVASHASNDSVYNNEIYLYDLNTGEERRITTSPQNDKCPDIDGSRIVWLRQTSNQGGDVFIYDLETGEETQISHSGYVSSGHSISGNRIVWADARSSKGNTNNDVVLNGQEPIADIYLYDLKTQEEMNLTDAKAWQVWMMPVICGDNVVFMLNRQIGSIVYALTYLEFFVII
jgi:beta propeller repeat protein